MVAQKVRPSSRQWEASWGVFFVTAVMSPETLRCFGAHGQKFRQHVWSLCAGRCSVRPKSDCAAKNLSACALSGESELAALTAFVAPPCPVTSFSAGRPWKWVVERTGVGSDTFWRDEFRSRATLVRTHVESLGKVLGEESSSQPSSPKQHLVGCLGCRTAARCGRRRRRRAHCVHDSLCRSQGQQVGTGEGGRWTIHHFAACLGHMLGVSDWQGVRRSRITSLGTVAVPTAYRNHMCDLCFDRTTSQSKDGKPCRHGFSPECTGDRKHSHGTVEKGAGKWRAVT